MSGPGGAWHAVGLVAGHPLDPCQAVAEDRSPWWLTIPDFWPLWTALSWFFWGRQPREGW